MQETPVSQPYRIRGKPFELARMLSPGILRRVALVRTDVSEERSGFIFRVTRIGELGNLSVTSN
jgi:hypothetical protein